MCSLCKKIIQYCQEVEQTCALFGHSKEAFENSFIFRNACGMCIIQIGELSEQTLQSIPSIPW